VTFHCTDKVTSPAQLQAKPGPRGLLSQSNIADKLRYEGMLSITSIKWPNAYKMYLVIKQQCSSLKYKPKNAAYILQILELKQKSSKPRQQPKTGKRSENDFLDARVLHPKRDSTLKQ
jgi:hypothetical protein